jgi:hypothetical protein
VTAMVCRTTSMAAVLPAPDEAQPSRGETPATGRRLRCVTGAPPSPPPQLDPVTDVGVARASVDEARSRLEGTLRRADLFSEEQRHQRVDDEWSTAESLRHLVLVVDLWLSRAILGQPDPFDPIALPPSFMPPTLFPGSSIDPEAHPSYDEVCEVLRGRLASLSDYVANVTAEDLGRSVDAHVGTVGGALAVILYEMEAHDRFINRDLDRLGPRQT